ncbi:latent-transforming growth factor beta-binding protein 2-like isoform X2 [Lineus longissimus]|uniref:latent-transforming growth factor beta-binding protein 2-like isoform X2 n=2 Tax=Lineus longissimus TaxID=88925 RepID=UPI002B4CD647
MGVSFQSVFASQTKMGIVRMSYWFLLLWNGVWCACPEGNWVQRKANEAFFRYERETKDFANAESSCVQNEGNLASLHNQEEFDLVATILEECGAQDAWIGLKDPAGKNLEWTDDTPVDFKITDTEVDFNEEHEECVRMRQERRNPWQWWDKDCTSEYPYICKKDINECTTNVHNCDANATCTNTKMSFTCTCKDGFRGTGTTCSDVDECATRVHNCIFIANSVCTNNIGSYTCPCTDGYRQKGMACEDINECNTSTRRCDTNAECTNTEGSFTCKCKTGYQGDAKTSCTDVDECATGHHNCTSIVNSVCANTNGSFTCPCKTGYEKGVFSCVDINECNTSTRRCDTNAECTNTEGSFTCKCKTGYQGDAKTSCTDVDECATGHHNCTSIVNSFCANTNGSFTCLCTTGYEQDGFSCVGKL